MKKAYETPKVKKAQKVVVSKVSFCARSGGTDCWSPERRGSGQC